MTKKQVWRYYCDYCGKGGLAGGHMKNHEKHCTANPNRACRMHVHTLERQKPLPDLLACLSAQLPNIGIDALRVAADGCPACMLAAVRQSKILKFDGDPENAPPICDWDFKKELAEFWAIVNDAKAQDEDDRRSSYYC